MGSSYQVTEQAPAPELELFFSNVKKREILPDVREIECLSLRAPIKKKIPDYHDNSDTYGAYPTISLESTNRNYYRDLVNFTVADKLYQNFYFSVKNTGTAVANDVRVEIVINSQGKVVKACDESDFPNVPRYSYSHLDNLNAQVPSASEYDLRVKEIDNYWLVQAKIDKVQPQNTGWIQCCLYVGAIESKDIVLDSTCFSDNLSEPAKKKLLIKSLVKSKDVSLSEIKEFDKERIRNSDWYKDYVKEHGLKSE